MQPLLRKMQLLQRNQWGLEYVILVVFETILHEVCKIITNSRTSYTFIWHGCRLSKENQSDKNHVYQ